MPLDCGRGHGPRPDMGVRFVQALPRHSDLRRIECSGTHRQALTRVPRISCLSRSIKMAVCAVMQPGQAGEGLAVGPREARFLPNGSTAQGLSCLLIKVKEYCAAVQQCTRVPGLVIRRKCSYSRCETAIIPYSKVVHLNTCL